ncbi:MAG: hypothetical protein EOM51_04300 [Clostridia bacterium]|nr:hypothetical protein [Clostridia bacterium]
MKRLILPLLFCLVLAFSLTGCGLKAENKPVVAEPSEAVCTETPTPDYEQSVDYSWKPNVLSEIYADIYGETFVADYGAMIDAFLSYENSFPCASAENVDAINYAAASCFPLLNMDVVYVQYDEAQKAGVLAYTMTKEEHLAAIETFKKAVTDFITESVKKSDSELTTALALYMNFSAAISYDYAALDSEAIVDVSPYRALLRHEGICQSFAPAYAYLCLQMGIDAVAAGGLATDDTAHEWTLVRLDGSNYYMDTTFENGEGGLGLKYFGMTTADRVAAGGYIEKTFNIGECNELWGTEISVDDSRFSAFRNVTYAVLDRKNGRIDCTDSDGTEWKFPLE